MTTEEPIPHNGGEITVVLGYDTVVTRMLLDRMSEQGYLHFFISFDEADEKHGSLSVGGFAEQFAKRNCKAIINLLPLVRFEKKPSDSKLAAITALCAQHALHTGCKYIHVTDALAYSGTDEPYNRTGFQPYDPIIPCANNDRATLNVVMEHAAITFMKMPDVERPKKMYVLRTGPILPTQKTQLEPRQCHNNLSHLLKLAGHDPTIRMWMPNKMALVSPITDQFFVDCVFKILFENVYPNIYNIGCSAPAAIARLLSAIEMKARKGITATELKDSANKSVLHLEDHRFSQALSPVQWTLATGMSIDYNSVIDAVARSFDDVMHATDE